MATRQTLPYFAPADQLPAPLPTVAEILASTQFMERLHAMRHPNVVRVGEHFVVKFGKPRDIWLQEGENMLFVRQATGLAVPTVYALFYDEATGYNFIVQEYIPGQSLQQYWKTADQSGKEAVVTQLRHYFDKLRSLPSPGYFGGVGRQDIFEPWVTAGGERMNVPACDTEEQYIEAMIQNAEVGAPTLSSIRFNFMKRMLRAVFRGHDSVFTHGDLHRSNIILRDDDNTVVLIDWATAGWYPSYVEYCNIIVLMAFETDWVEWIPRFLDEWIHEVGWMFHLVSWTFYRGGLLIR